MVMRKTGSAGDEKVTEVDADQTDQTQRKTASAQGQDDGTDGAPFTSEERRRIIRGEE